jgi:PEP-CTERM/exosortase A-associated glycosyltransferase
MGWVFGAFTNALGVTPERRCPGAAIHTHPESSLRVLHVFDHSLPVQDGYSSRSWAILQNQLALGWDVFAVTGPRHGGNGEAEETVAGFRFFRTRPDAGLLARLPVIKQLWRIRLFYQRIAELIPEHKPDVLHAHSPALNGVAAWWAAKRHGLPLVYEVRAFWEDAAVDQGTGRENGLRYRLTRALENFVFQRADRVTAICAGLSHDIEARGLLRDPVTVIPNAVEVDRFAAVTEPDLALAQRLGLKLGHTLGFVGSFYDYEGLDQAIAAMPRLLQTDPHLRLLLVGGGVQDAALRAQALRLGLAEQVVFTGKVPFAEVEHYYALIDVLVYPRKSLRLTETVTPLKPLEAMAQRKVFVASDVGGHRELIEDGVTGLLFQADHQDALIAAVQRMMASPELRETLREQGLRFVREQRNWRNSVARYEAVYRGAVSRCRKRLGLKP